MRKTTTILDTITANESETYQLAIDFSSALKPAGVVALFGDLGAGKTVFVKGVCHGLRVTQSVNSPTYVIMNEYPGFCQNRPITVRHFDFYRLTRESEVEELGLCDFFYQPDSVSLIEWADNATRFLPGEYWRVRLSKSDEFHRKLTIEHME